MRDFYRTDCLGSIPQHGAVLLLPNHPNSLLDPALVWATTGRDVRFLAKSTLFDGPFGLVLRGAGAIPVYRRIGSGVDTSKNVETFAAVSAAFAAGDAVCIFPEGISHSTGRLEPLRTGAARMTLDAGAPRHGSRAHPGRPQLRSQVDVPVASHGRVRTSFFGARFVEWNR